MRRSDVPVAIVLALAAASLYAPTLGYDFTLWDDDSYVLANPLIFSFDLESIRKIFSNFYMANYSPLHLLSYVVVYAGAGAAPWAYHALNVALHAACTVLGFLLLRRTALPRFAAALGAAIFLAHPAQVEAVAWVNQTKTLLAALFGMASLLAFVRFRDQRAAGGGAMAYGASLALFACALLSKPQAVAFPGLFFCFERALQNSDRRAPLVAWAPFLLLSAGGAWLTILAQASVGAIKAYGPLGVLGNVLATPVVLVRYLRIALIPTDLSVMYTMAPVRVILEPRVIGAFIILALLAAVAWRARASGSRPWHALGVFVVPLLPVLGWVPLNIPMADRYLYPSILALSWVAAGLVGGLSTRMRAAIWIVPILLGLLSLHRMPAWRDGESVWTTEVREHPDSPRAWIGKASYRFRIGDVAGAEADVRRSIALDDQNHESWTNLGVYQNQEGRADEAVEAWRRALALEPRADWPKLLIARDLSRRGEHPEARRLLDLVLAERPNFAMAYLYRAAARQRTGDDSGAEADIERAAAFDPFLPDAHEALGLMREKRGDHEGARAAYVKFLEVWAGDPVRADQVRERIERLSQPEAS